MGVLPSFDAALFLITCEHGGNRVPSPYLRLFDGNRRVLRSDRAFDPGSLPLATRFARGALLDLPEPDGSYPELRIAVYAPGSPLREPSENMTGELARWAMLVAGNLQ